jgi:hypothetical protein
LDTHPAGLPSPDSKDPFTSEGTSGPAKEEVVKYRQARAAKTTRFLNRIVNALAIFIISVFAGTNRFPSDESSCDSSTILSLATANCQQL